MIRNDDELDRAIRYILENPAKARIKELDLGLERGLGSPRHSRPGGRRYRFVALGKNSGERRATDLCAQWERFRTRSRLRGFDVLYVNYLRLLVELASHFHRLAFERLGFRRVVQPEDLAG